MRQPPASVGSMDPTATIVAAVRRNPAAVCTASAEPAVPGGASSLTAVENCAESATTVTPHTSATARTMGAGAPKSRPVRIADVPETASAAIVSVVRPSRSAMSPGFAGIDNELYYNPKTAMLFGDAKSSVERLVAGVKAV